MNSELYNNKYPVPKEIIAQLQAKVYNNNGSGEGIKRAKGIANNGYITYQQLKRLKNYFDYYDGKNPQEFELAGGQLMKHFVDNTLNNERTRTANSKEIKRDLDVNRNDSSVRAQDGSVNLREGEAKEIVEPENTVGLKRNALAVIINNDKQILLLKRSGYEDQWMPNKIGLVGGGVEEGEEPIDAVKREIFEETGLEINKFKEKFVLQRSEDSVEHMFIAKYEGDSFDVKLNEEHSGYLWVTLSEIQYLDTVPNLFEYVQIALTKYE